MILGISISHCSSAALIKEDGSIIATVSEERFTRIKDESGFPERSIAFLMKDINPKDIKYAAFGAKLWEKQMPLVSFKKRVMANILRDRFERNIFYTLVCFFEYLGLTFKKIYPEEYFRKILGKMGLGHVKIVFVDHHLAHAAGAFYSSMLEDPLIITVDGIGDDKSASVNIYENNAVKILHQARFYGSPGAFYGLITALCGFKPNRHEGKITGLAAMGNADALPEMNEMLKVEKDGEDLIFVCPLFAKIKRALLLNTPRFIFEYVRWFIKKETYADFMSKMEQIVARGLFKNIIKKKTSIKDIAAGAQQILEKRIAEFIGFYLKKIPKKALILAGGVFANVKLNQRLFNLAGVENIFVHPGMGDEGTALGAAYHCLSQIKPDLKARLLKDVYLGPAYSDEEIEKALKKYKIKYSKIEDEAVIAKKTAQLIAEGKIIGFFRGRMEYGPRALGARSVLADPRKKEMHDILNERMKRSEFMPFAPVIPYERMNEILDGKIKGSEHTAEFMTITYDVKKEWQGKIPAVVHVDGTARPQLIKREINSLYYDIVTEFGKITGVPVIINTSFNMHEEPIVCTPEDAIRSYLQGCVDVMVMERFVVGEIVNSSMV
ncbi:MAG: carbamoyltransferase C-terminal domain-containing protein [Candidatus Omnitrophota bacterium]